MSDLSLSGSPPFWGDENTLKISPQSANVLNSALTGVQSQLQEFFSSPTALERLDRVFEIANQNAANLLVQNGAAGIFDSMPHLQILNDAAMNGAQGAFSKTENTIYLADSLLGGDVRQVEEVLIEEIGHKFDVLLNPGWDTRGDEGELFKNVVLGLPLSDSELLRIQTEDDSSFVVIDNQQIAVEQAYNSTDVTGDGKADAIVSNNEGVYVRRSDGSKFLPNEKWTDIGYWGTKGTWFADVTGDGKADAIVSNNEGVYVRRSDGSKFLPNEKWTDIGYWGSRVTGFGDVTGDGKADAIVSNDDGVYVRRSNGSKFLPNEKWTDIGYWGSKGTWIGDVTLGYYGALSSLSESQWDQQSGDNNGFEQNPVGGGGDQRWKTDDRIEQIYTDLSNDIFGYRVPMTTGYAYDQSYYSYYGTWHAGLDMGANNGATIKAPLGGTVAWLSGSGDGNIFVEVNSDDGRQWVYGHLKSSSGLWTGKRINSGETVGIVGAQNHLHLEVENGQAYGNTQGAMTNQGTLLSATVSPLMAYWKWRNR
ncbi:FG-GAP-like repeat-containing protein [Kamptonema formosum]|uniref:FG-GAP-like repeat-containing protein n=1 Tax=Kamptonema formosum TaxID=331992 RepID=UPI000344B638|nr:FG-GAP-like repeat-containing protein [Oscillatoria sp. PCC 10802]